MSDLFEIFKETEIKIDEEMAWLLAILEGIIPKKAKESLLYKKTVAFNKDI